MLLALDPRVRVFGISPSSTHPRLRDDRPAVDRGVDEVHGDAGELHAVGDRLPLCVRRRGTPEQRGVSC